MEDKQNNGSALTSYERETVITYNNAEKTANCFSLSMPTVRRLLKLAEEYPEEVHINRVEDDMIDADVPKSWIKIRPPRRISDEQREALAQRGREMYEKHLKGENG